MRQRFVRLWLALALVALTAWALAAPAALAVVKFSTTLTGAAEAPGPGDPEGTGTFTARINIGEETLCYTLTFSGIGDPTGAHIHFAPVGEPGDVVIPLVPTAPPDTCVDCITSTCIRPSSQRGRSGGNSANSRSAGETGDPPAHTGGSSVVTAVARRR
jgi:hypothetical protein